MFINDEPSKSEDELGILCGNVGELLLKWLKMFKCKKRGYLTTLVKCKSLNGLNQILILICNDYLLKQIELIKPN